MISVTPTMQAAAIAFFNSSSPNSFPFRYSPGSTAQNGGNRSRAAYTARNSASYTLRNTSSQEFSGRRADEPRLTVGDTGFEPVASAV
jgi:hypothetical protein